MYFAPEELITLIAACEKAKDLVMTESSGLYERWKNIYRTIARSSSDEEALGRLS